MKVLFKACKLEKAKGLQIGRNEGKQIGRNEEKYEVAKNMLANNYSITEVSRITGLSISELNKLLKS